MSDRIFYPMVFAIAMAVIIPLVLLASSAQENKDFSLWSRGYCAALSGEYVTDEVCNVDGKVVTIPREEFTP